MSAYNQLCTEFYDLDKPHEPAEAFAFGLVTDLAQARESLHRLHAHMIPSAKLVFEVARPSASAPGPGVAAGSSGRMARCSSSIGSVTTMHERV